MIKSEYRNIYNHEDRHFIYVSMHNTILKLLNLYLKNKDSKKIKILDAGCGTGGLLKKLENKGNIYGIDISPEGIKLAKKRGLKKLRVGTVTKLTYKSNTFDVVLCIDVLYHREVDDVKAINEFARVLKPNGILIIKVPAYNWLRGKHDSIAHTKHRFTKTEINKKIKSANLRILKSTYQNTFILPLALIKRFIDSSSKEKPKSDVVNVYPMINNFFVFLSSIEDALIKWFDLPFGLTIFSVASKPNKDKNKKSA